MARKYVSPDALDKLQSLGLLTKSEVANARLAELVYDMDFKDSSSTEGVFRHLDRLEAVARVTERDEVYENPECQIIGARVAEVAEWLTSLAERLQNKEPRRGQPRRL